MNEQSIKQAWSVWVDENKKVISIKENPVQPKPSSSAKYYVQVGAYAQKENAEKQLKKAKDAGFSDAFIKEF